MLKLRDVNIWIIHVHFPVIMIPVLVLICIVSIIFYWQTLSYQYVISDRKYHALEELNRRISTYDRRVVGRTLSGRSTASTTTGSISHV